MTFDQERHDEMVGRIDEALNWAPGDPIYEVEYNSDWAGENYIRKARCTDCDVSWEGEEQDCWSCGKTTPKLIEWWKNVPGTDEIRLNIHIDPTPFQEQMDRMWGAINRAPIGEVSLGFRTLSERMSDMGDVFLRTFERIQLVDVRRIQMTSPRRSGHTILYQSIDEWNSPEVQQLLPHRVSRERVELLPPTPKVFDFNLGLTETRPVNLSDSTQVQSTDAWEIWIPSEIPTKQIPLPEPRPVLVPAHFSWDLTPQSLARAITTERRSRHI